MAFGLLRKTAKEDGKAELSSHQVAREGRYSARSALVIGVLSALLSCVLLGAVALVLIPKNQEVNPPSTPPIGTGTRTTYLDERASADIAIVRTATIAAARQVSRDLGNCRRKSGSARVSCVQITAGHLQFSSQFNGQLLDTITARLQPSSTCGRWAASYQGMFNQNWLVTRDFYTELISTPTKWKPVVKTLQGMAQEAAAASRSSNWWKLCSKNANALRSDKFRA